MISKHPLIVGPIIYHPGIDDNFHGWATACGYNLAELRRLGEQAIRNHHPQATMLDRASGPRPDVWELSFGRARVIYTIEPHNTVIRGYSWDIKGEPLDDFDGGGHYLDASWHEKP